MELWDVYDKDRIKTGRTMVRGAEFAPDSYYLIKERSTERMREGNSLQRCRKRGCYDKRISLFVS